MNKFNNVPVEEDTTILFQQEATLGTYDGVNAESLIFEDKDVSGLDDNEIEMNVRTSPLLSENSQITLVRSSGFTFVNFNFLTE